MQPKIKKKKLIIRLLFTLFVVGSFAFGLFAQSKTTPQSGRIIYDHIKSFSLDGGKTDVNGLVLKRDRVTMTFSGTFYFTSSVDNKVTGAVFLGKGTFSAEAPPSDFEKGNIKRLLGTESIRSNFKTAVLRFTDDTFDVIGKNVVKETGVEKAQKIARETDILISKETGANIPARLTLSIVNREKLGFFFAAFSGGKRGNFRFVLDHQTRVPTDFFEINGGEKGLIYSYDSAIFGSQVWTAFYSLADYKNRVVEYSDMNDLVDIEHYKMIVDLRNPKKLLKLKANVKMKSRTADLKAISFRIGESLGEFRNQRLKKQMRLKSVQLNSIELDAVQEDWDSQLLVFLGKKFAKEQRLELEFQMEGDFMRQSSLVNHCHYPRSNTTWYPRHGYLDRATYEFRYIHPGNFTSPA